MSCQVELFADCSDISCLARALFITEKDDNNWLSQCSISLSSCGGVLAVGHKSRLCLLTSQWISTTNSHSYLISWMGTLSSEITTLLALPVCPPRQSSQVGPDWICIIVGLKNGTIEFYTNTGHLLLQEKLSDTPVLKISCHTGTYGTMPYDIHIFFKSCNVIITGSSLFKTLRYAKSQLAKAQAGVQDIHSVDSRNIDIKKWLFCNQESVNDAAVVGLQVKNSYDHLLSVSTYGGYDTWYRSVPPMSTLILGAGSKPYLGFHYAMEGNVVLPIGDLARAVANKIISALPGWLGGGSTENASTSTEPQIQCEELTMQTSLVDAARTGMGVVVSPDRRLAAVVDALGRVVVLDVARGRVVRMFKGYRDAQCAFVQIFDKMKNQHKLSLITDICRAIFLIIYNPKKGLIEIILMESGTRIAVFTATKYGKLLYNTCGLVGTDKDYHAHRKVNIPEFQCVLIDPDGKLKKFKIPFYHALEGDNSKKCKDLHILNELREYLNENTYSSENYENEIMEKMISLQTLKRRKYGLEMLLEKYEITPKIVVACVNEYWHYFNSKVKLNEKECAAKVYFSNLALVTLFFERLNNDHISEEMLALVDKIHEYLHIKKTSKENTSNAIVFKLLENDNCTLQKLLSLAQDNNASKEDQDNKVVFAEDGITFKQFVSCFSLDRNSKHIHLIDDAPPYDKLISLSSQVFKSLFQLNNILSLSSYIIESNLDPQDVMKLLILHLMKVSMDEINTELIEKFMEVSYYLTTVSQETTEIEYSEISPWWGKIRCLLVEMPCPLRSLIVAMACKAVGKIIENEKEPSDEDNWESLSVENAEWSILIGKLEDISILSIIIAHRSIFNGKLLPILKLERININLKYIYSKGKGSVTEIIAKWLCSMGVPADVVVLKEMMETYVEGSDEIDSETEDYTAEALNVRNRRGLVDNNPEIFKWYSLLRQQFPLSTKAMYVIANMGLEYALAWQKQQENVEYLGAMLHCLDHVKNRHVSLGLFAIIWSIHLKPTFESICRLLNKVGTIPGDFICGKVGLNSGTILSFLDFLTGYFQKFISCFNSSVLSKKEIINYERIWGKGSDSLVELAQNQKRVNRDLLEILYQISLAFCCQCHLNVKFSKPLDVLFDLGSQSPFEGLTEIGPEKKFSAESSERTEIPRERFLIKLIRTLVSTVSIDANNKYVFTEYHDRRVQQMKNLAKSWRLNRDYVTKQLTVAYYHVGYDYLAVDTLEDLYNAEEVLEPLVAISINRMKRNLQASHNKLEWIAAMQQHIYARIRDQPLQASVPANPNMETTLHVLKTLQYRLKECKEIKNQRDFRFLDGLVKAVDNIITYHL